jgi:hypothetical protein
MPTDKVVIPVRLDRDQVRAIAKRVAGSAILDRSKFIRLAIDHLLACDLGEVLKEHINASLG